jgi:hypothetical protein
MVETVSLGNRPGPLRDDLLAFYAESEAMLVDGIAEAFRDAPPPVPPDRLARLVRLGLHGLVIELAYARDERERAAVERSYRDLRELFQRVCA